MKLNESSIFYYKAPFIGQQKNSAAAKLSTPKKNSEIKQRIILASGK
jgi:hypothetical protein